MFLNNRNIFLGDALVMGNAGDRDRERGSTSSVDVWATDVFVGGPWPAIVDGILLFQFVQLEKCPIRGYQG